MTEKRWRATTKSDLIIEVWEALDCESVGARELQEIQQALWETFGEGGLASPASIARTVADEGAVLRHPEVFEFDGTWRERLILGAVPLESLSFASLPEGSESMLRLDSCHRELTAERKQMELRRLREFALKTKRDLQLVARSRVFDPKRRAEAGEMAQWLTIWLQDPAIFADWLDLRKRSPQFVEKFPG